MIRNLPTTIGKMAQLITLYISFSPLLFFCFQLVFFHMILLHSNIDGNSRMAATIPSTLTNMTFLTQLYAVYVPTMTVSLNLQEYFSFQDSAKQRFGGFAARRHPQSAHSNVLQSSLYFFHGGFFILPFSSTITNNSFSGPLPDIPSGSAASSVYFALPAPRFLNCELSFS